MSNFTKICKNCNFQEFGKLISCIEDERDRMLERAYDNFIVPLDKFRKVSFWFVTLKSFLTLKKIRKNIIMSKVQTQTESSPLQVEIFYSN